MTSAPFFPHPRRWILRTLRGGRDGQGGDAGRDHGAALPAGLETGDPRSGRSSMETSLGA